MKLQNFICGFIFILSWQSSAQTLSPMIADSSDVIVPLVNGDSDVQARAGNLYYDIGVGLKIINADGSAELISSSGTNPVTSGGTNERIERIKYYTTSFGTVCSVSTCGVTSSDPGISVTRVSTGFYTINFPSGMWSSPPTCVIYPANNTNTVIPFNTGLTISTTAYQFKTNDTAALGLLNTYGDIICMGPK